jgi:glucose-1-phosphate thymidylyltransferase
MIAVLLCAGFATRLFPLTRDIPKPLLPVAGRPVIDYLMDQIIGLPGIESIHIVTNARFYKHFTWWHQKWQACLAPRDITLTVYNDGATANENRLGACSDLQLVFRQTGRTGAYLVSAGDNIYFFRIADLWRHFLRGHRHCIVALAENDLERLKDTGVPVFGKNNRVLGVLEKPDTPPPGWFCPPLYFLRSSARKVLEDFLGADGPVDAPGHFIDYLCRREPVAAIKLNEKRLDIGNLESYRRADKILRDGPGRV